MKRSLIVALAQLPTEPKSDANQLVDHINELVEGHPGVDLWALPEFHLEHGQAGDNKGPTRTRTLGDPTFTRLADVARNHGVWLVPGTFRETADDGGYYNTAAVFSPSGELVASYRKIFPWRPTETSIPGNSFVVFDIPEIGRVGLSICYDMWFPEHVRHLAWLGADVILNLVQTPTSDREQEQAIVRANAIMNQVWIASVNSAYPTGLGRSLVVDPNGSVRVSAGGSNPEVLTVDVDFALSERTQRVGVAGVSKPWSHFRTGDAEIQLPLYNGHIDPETWSPRDGERRNDNAPGQSAPRRRRRHPATTPPIENVAG